MEAAIRALLAGYAPLTSLVGGSSTPRIVWNHLPQATARPAVVLYKISGAEGLTYSGPDGLAEARIQIDVQALTPNSMWAIRDAIIAKLHGHRDATFGKIEHVSERQTSEELAGGGSLIHRSSLDFTIWAAA